MNTTNKCPEGMHQVMSCLSPAEHQAIKDAGTAREKLGRQGAQRVVTTECTRFGIRHLDRQTGELPASIENWPSRKFPTTIFANDEDLHRTMDAYPYPCWTARPNNAFVYANPLLVQFTGRPLAEFSQDRGMGWLNMIHPEDQTRVKRICLEGFQSLGAFQFFYRLIEAGGKRWGWVEDWAYPYSTPTGHLAGYVGLMIVRGYERNPAAALESIISL